VGRGPTSCCMHGVCGTRELPTRSVPRWRGAPDSSALLLSATRHTCVYRGVANKYFCRVRALGNVASNFWASSSSTLLSVWVSEGFWFTPETLVQRLRPCIFQVYLGMSRRMRLFLAGYSSLGGSTKRRGRTIRCNWTNNDSIAWWGINSILLLQLKIATHSLFDYSNANRSTFLAT
jgi:hypothetical protein